MSGISNGAQAGRGDNFCADNGRRNGDRSFFACLKCLSQRLPEFFPSLVCLILVIVLSIVVQTESNLSILKEFYSQLFELSEFTGKRLDVIESIIVKMGIDCGVDDLELKSIKDNRLKLEEMIKKRIEEFDCIRNGRINWASSSLGGRVIKVTGAGPSFNSSSFLGLPCLRSSDPSSLISKSSHKTDCWTFKGEGKVLLQLATSIYISHFTIEHFPQDALIPKKDVISAPKLIIFKGYRHKNDASPHTFGAYEFKLEDGPGQTFPVNTPSKSQFEIVEFLFKSNHGNHEYTCVHKIQVHGRLLSDPTSPLNTHI